MSVDIKPSFVVLLHRVKMTNAVYLLCVNGSLHLRSISSGKAL